MAGLATDPAVPAIGRICDAALGARLCLLVASIIWAAAVVSTPALAQAQYNPYMTEGYTALKSGTRCIWDPPQGNCTHGHVWDDEVNPTPPEIVASNLRIYASGAGKDSCRAVDYQLDGQPLVAFVYDTDRFSMERTSSIDRKKRPSVKTEKCIIGRLEKIPSTGGYQDSTERAPSAAEDLFGAALTKSPEQLRAEAEAARRRADDASQSSGSNPLIRDAAIAIGGAAAARTGNTRLFEAITQSTAAAGSSSECEAAKNNFQTDLTAASKQARDACATQRAAVNTWDKHRASVAQACRGTPNYAAMMKESDDYAGQARQYLARNCR